MRSAEEPEAERREVGVGAREKISAGWAVHGGVSGGWLENGRGENGGTRGWGSLPSSTV